MSDSDLSYYLVVYVGPFALVALGLFLLWVARSEDAENFVVTRAPTLKISQLHRGDDAWIFGELKVEQPVYIPKFNIPCVYYKYEKEQLVWTTDSKGRKVRRWKIVETKSAIAPFTIIDQSGSVTVDNENVSFVHAQRTGLEYETSEIRHSAIYEPPEGPVGLMGYYDGKQMHAYKDCAFLDGGAVPVYVIRTTLEAYTEAEEQAERWFRRFGFLILYLGFTAVITFFKYLGYLTFGTPSFLCAVPLIIGWWAVYTFNTFVIYRTRTKNALKQIGIELKQRLELVPRLEAIVRGYCKHEKEVTAKITMIRNGMENEQLQKLLITNKAKEAVTRFICLAEEYPGLKANENFQLLQNELVTIEGKIANARSFYNRNVEEYNTLCQTVPYYFFARLGGFKLFEFYGEEFE